MSANTYYCSQACRDKAIILEVAAGNPKAKRNGRPTAIHGELRNCVVCGNEFLPRANNQVKCREQCLTKARKPMPMGVVSCPTCHRVEASCRCPK